MRCLSVWLPNWPIQRVIKDHAELKNRPFALYQPNSRGGFRVEFVSAAAREQGIEPGQPVADATARLGKKLRLFRHDPVADLRQLRQLAMDCEPFSPIIGFSNSVSDQLFSGWKDFPTKNLQAAHSVSKPKQARSRWRASSDAHVDTIRSGQVDHVEDTLVFDIDGIGRLFEGEQKLAEEVVNSFHRWGYTVRLAIAPTLGAAWAFSHFGNFEPFFVAKSDFASQLQTLPLAALRLPQKVIHELFELGLEKIEDILELPRESLASRFPQEVLWRLDQALGAISESIQPLKPQQEFEVAWDFFYPTHQAGAILAVLSQLTDRLVALLQAKGHGTSEVACKITCEPKALIVQSVGLYQASANAKHIFELLRLKFEQLRLPAPVASLSLQATRTSRLVPRQRELFSDERKDHSNEFAVLVDQLTGRLGEKGVVRPKFHANAQPEWAFREEPLVAFPLKRQPPSARRDKAHSGRHVSYPFAPLERPTILYQRPILIDVEGMFPDGPLNRFQWNQRAFHIESQFGPERIETGWWGKRGIRRDYYRVETECGAWFWIFRSLDNNQWFLHGEFG